MRIILTAILLLFSGHSTALETDSPVLTVHYFQTTNQQQIEQENLLKSPDALPAIVEFINATLIFNSPTKLQIGAEDGPLFDPATNIIDVPWSFLEEIESRFREAETDLSQQELDEAVLDVLMHTLLHEIGHALVAQYDIPVLAKEEDAVDGLANLLLLEYAEGGDQIALTAADMYSLEDADVKEFEEADYWDEHSLDIQRFYSTICNVYGSDPDYQTELINEDLLSEERAEQCIDEYEQLRYSWLTVLEPMLRD